MICWLFLILVIGFDFGFDSSISFPWKNEHFWKAGKIDFVSILDFIAFRFVQGQKTKK